MRRWPCSYLFLVTQAAGSEGSAMQVKPALSGSFSVYAGRQVTFKAVGFPAWARIELDASPANQIDGIIVGARFPCPGPSR